jgi:hypothetical protein
MAILSIILYIILYSIVYYSNHYNIIIGSLAWYYITSQYNRPKDWSESPPLAALLTPTKGARPWQSPNASADLGLGLRGLGCSAYHLPGKLT